MSALQVMHAPEAGSAGITGRHLFDGDSCQYAAVVRPGDLVSADFDVKNVGTGGGLYLIEAFEKGRVVWRGCRKLMRVPEGIAVDQDGRGNWVTVTDLSSIGWTVAATVMKVYRET